MVTLSNIVDTYVFQQKASTNYAGSQTLTVRSASGSNAQAYVLAKGIPSGDDVLTGTWKLRVFSAGVAPSMTLTVRRVTAPWTSSRVNWSNKPATTDTGMVSVTQAAVKGTVWEFDISAIVALWSAGTPNYGLQITTNSATGRLLYSSEASGSSAVYKPVLEGDWSTAPSAPTNLVPGNGQQVSIARPTLTWVYGDDAGSEMAAYQLQGNSSDVWTAPGYDSGEVASNLPQHVLTFDTPIGSPSWWRVRTKSAAGRWSDWSEGELFGRTLKPALTITNPAASPNNYVTEYTPPHTWTFAGTQERFQVITTVAATGAVQQSSGEVTGTDSGYTHKKPLVFTGGDLTDEVRVWDNVDRASTPGDPAYISATRTYGFVPSSSVTPVSALSVTSDGVRPVATATWTRATAPDSFTILNDGVVVAADVQPEDVLVSGTSYSFTPYSVRPNSDVVWTVIPVENGVAAASNPTFTYRARTQYIWLLDPDNPNWWLAIAGQESGTWDMGEQSDLHEIRGSDRLVLISQALRGYEGTISGGLYSALPGLGGLTAQQLRDRVWDLKRYPTKTWRLVLSDMNIPVVVRKAVPTPTPHAELDFELSMEFFQQGQDWWS